MTHAIVLIGDLIESRKLKNSDRNDTQADLKKILGRVNRDAAGILSPWTITLGDEFQAVYQSADSVFQHLWMIAAAIHPVHARICISPGVITTPLNRRQSIGMDGPAFHSARDGINILKQGESLLRVNLDDPEIARVVNASLTVVSKEMLRWNGNRFHILQKLVQGLEVSRIASDLGLSEVAIYKNRKAGSLDVIHELTSGISALINSGLTHSGSAHSGSISSGPANSGPAQSGPASSGSAHSRSAISGPAHSGSAHSGSISSGPASSRPAHSGPAISGPAHSGIRPFRADP